MEQTHYYLSEQLGCLLRVKGWRLCLAESCTGGGVASAITEIPGSSEWFDRAAVTYSNEAKRSMLGVTEEALGQEGAVSQWVAEQMAEGILKKSDAHIALSVTGIAGPGGGSPEKPVGIVWFAVAVADGVEAREAYFSGDRASIRSAAVSYALRWLIDVIR